MANRMTCYLEHDPIVIDCKCGAQYCLYYISSTEDKIAPTRFLREFGKANFCPFCGKDHRTEEHKRAISIQENGEFSCPTCHTINPVEKGKGISCTRCGWKPNPLAKEG